MTFARTRLAYAGGLALLLALPMIFACCNEEKSTRPPIQPTPDWWTVDDCDEAALYNFTGYKWANLQPAVRYSTSLPDDWRAQAGGAIAAWNAAGSRLQIAINATPVPNTVGHDGLNVVSRGTIAENPMALGVTYSWYQGPTQTEVDIMISSDRPITIGGYGGTYDLRSVMTHEFGHFCGLGDVGSQKQTMAWEQHVESMIYWTLCPGDIQGLMQLYP